MDTGISNARRLVRTELNYVHNHAALDSIADSGIKYFRFIATLDKRTTQICRSHDSHVYPISEAKQGQNVPPLHPNCRSTIAGSLRGPGNIKTGTRAARNEKGKTVFVPSSMNYDDWKTVYVDKSQTLADWFKAHTPPKSEKMDLLAENTKKLAAVMSAKDYAAYMANVKGSPMAGMYEQYGDAIDDIALTNNNVTTGEGGYYRNNKITFAYDAKGNKYSTLAHEYGHFFAENGQYTNATWDEFGQFWGLLGVKKDTYDVSLSDIFLKALRDDKKQAVNLWKKDANAFDDINSERVQDTLRGFGATTRWGHPSSYYHLYSNMALKKWKDVKKLYNGRGLTVKRKLDIANFADDYMTAKETFANMVSAYTLSDKAAVAYYEKYLPSTWDAFKKLINNATRKKLRQTGGRTVAQFMQGEEDAKLYYQKIRERKDDVLKIAQNTGLSKKFIQSVKEHVFYDVHKLDTGTGLFACDYNIAVAWQRLINGKYEKRDILLLRHEHLERALEIRYNLTIRQAHELTDKKYSWDKVVKKLFPEDGGMEDVSLSEIIKQEPE